MHMVQSVLKVSATDISAATSMTLEDIHSTLVHLNMISVLDSSQAPKPLPGQTIKFPKGRKNGIARKHLQRSTTHDDEKVKGPFVPPTRYKVRWDAEQVEEYLARWEAKGHLKLHPEKLKWSPFILSRAHKTQSSEGEVAAGQNGVFPGSSAEDTLTESNGATVDGVEVGKTRSPAFALFDDDNVEVVRASASRDSAASETAEADVRSPSAEPVPRTRPKRNRTRDVGDPPSIRRLRSRDSVNESTPVGRRLYTPRREASSRSERRKNPTRSRLDVSSTPMSRPDFRGTTSPSVDDDAAYAAMLAQELDQPRRQLRGRRPSAAESPQVPSRLVSTPRSPSPRKRRRVDSSPEVERTPALRASVSRRASRRAVVSLPPNPKSTPTSAQKQQRQSNGRFSRTSKPRPSRSAVVALRQEEEEDEQLPAAGVYAEGDYPYNGYVAAADDSKYDDADTSATGITAASRHSVPSDDTMIGGDSTGVTGGEPQVKVATPALDALSVLASVAAEERHNYIIDFGPVEGVPQLGDFIFGDEDAEGEDDPDAEGEPDYDEDV